MHTPEMAAEVALDVLLDLARSGTYIRSPEGSGAIFTVEEYGTPLQQAKLSRLRLAADRKHGAEPSRSKAESDGDAMDRVGRAIDRALGLDQP